MRRVCDGGLRQDPELENKNAAAGSHHGGVILLGTILDS